MSQFWKNLRTDGPYFIGPFRPRPGVQQYSNLVLSEANETYNLLRDAIDIYISCCVNNMKFLQNWEVLFTSVIHYEENVLATFWKGLSSLCYFQIVSYTKITLITMSNYTTAICLFSGYCDFQNVSNEVLLERFSTHSAKQTTKNKKTANLFM